MSSIFGPKPPPVIPPVNPADTANRLNSGLVRRLMAGGTNADTTGAMAAGTAAPRAPVLTGLN